jgi:hypothetical protein
MSVYRALVSCLWVDAWLMQVAEMLEPQWFGGALHDASLG